VCVCDDDDCDSGNILVYGCACIQYYLVSLYVQYLCTCIAHAKLRGLVCTGVCACAF